MDAMFLAQKPPYPERTTSVADRILIDLSFAKKESEVNSQFDAMEGEQEQATNRLSELRGELLLELGKLKDACRSEEEFSQKAKELICSARRRIDSIRREVQETQDAFKVAVGTLTDRIKASCKLPETLSQIDQANSFLSPLTSFNFPQSDSFPNGLSAQGLGTENPLLRAGKRTQSIFSKAAIKPGFIPERDLLNAAMKTARVATVSLKAAGIGFIGYAVITGSAAPLAFSIATIGLGVYGITKVVDKCLPESWKEAYRRVPEQLENHCGVSQEEAKQFVEDLEFLVLSAIVAPGVGAARSRCASFINKIMRGSEGVEIAAVKFLEAPGKWEMHRLENLPRDRCLAFCRERDPTLYICALEEKGMVQGIDSAIESSIRQLAQKLGKENVYLTFAQVEKTAFERALLPASFQQPPAPPLQRLLVDDVNVCNEKSWFVFWEQRYSKEGCPIAEYFVDTLIGSSSLEKLDIISAELGKAFGKLHSHFIAVPSSQRVEEDCQRFLRYYEDVLQFAEGTGRILPHSRAEIDAMVKAIKKNPPLVYGFCYDLVSLESGKVLYDETSSKINFTGQGMSGTPLYGVPEDQRAEYEFLLFEHMAGLGFTREAQDRILTAWRRGYQETYSHPSLPEVNAFYQTLAFYESSYLLIEREQQVLLSSLWETLEFKGSFTLVRLGSTLTTTQRCSQTIEKEGGTVGGWSKLNAFDYELSGERALVNEINYKVVKSDLGEKILMVMVGMIGGGKGGLLASYLKKASEIASENQVDRAQVVAIFENKKLEEICKQRYGFLQQAPWVYEVPLA